MTKQIIIVFISIVINATVLSQMSQLWLDRFDSSSHKGNIPNDMVIDRNGNILIAATGYNAQNNSDLMVIKYSPNGNLLWFKAYAGSSNNNDMAKAIRTDFTGNVYVTGSVNVSDKYHTITIKYSPDGDMRWLNIYNSSSQYQDSAVSMDVDDMGNVYILASSYGNGDFLTIKYDANGTESWSKYYNKILPSPYVSVDVPKKLVIAKDISGLATYVYVTGKTDSINTYYDITTVCYNYNGDKLWENTYDGAAHQYDYAVDIAVDDYLTPKIYVTGNESGSGINSSDYVTICYYWDGNISSVKKYNGPGNLNDFTSSLFAERSGDNYVFITGRIDGTNTPNYGTVCYRSGTEMWASIYNGPSNLFDAAYDVAYDYISKLIYTIGTSTGNGSGLDYCLVQYDINGVQKSVQRYNNSIINGMDIGRLVAVDYDGNIIVTGSSVGSAALYNDIVTIKYGNTIGIEQINNEVPEKFELYQNYPNPFNPSTKFRFSTDEEADVSLIVYDVSGKLLEIIAEGRYKAGLYEVTWDASEYSSGTYFYRIQAGKFVETKKMILVK